MGAEGGIQIAKALMARNWISAHDEAKDDRGVGVKLLKCDRTDVDSVQRKIALLDNTWRCNVVSLDVGASMTMTSSDGAKDLKMARHNNGEGLGLGVEATGFRFHDGG